MRIETLRKRVARGVREVLDAKDPGWWENGKTPNGIDIDKLDLRDEFVCILGQREGGFDSRGFWGAVDRLRISRKSIRPGIEYGFNLEGEPLGGPNWSRLTELWIDVIQSRRFPRREKPEWVVEMGLDKAAKETAA